MKTTAILFLTLCLWAPVRAQDLFLPLTTPSQNARFHYEQAMLKAYNADFAGFDASMERALLADSALFMARYQQAIFALYFGDQEGFRAFGGKALAHAGEKNLAEQRLRQILAKLSDDPATYVGDDFAEIAAMYPWVLEAQSAVSFYERRQKNHDKAIAAAKRSVALRPDFGPGYNTLAYAFLAAGKRDFAQAAMEKYRDLQPEHPNPYDSLGDLCMEAGDYRKAAQHYLTAYEKDPNWIAGKEKAAYALKKSFAFRTAPAPEWSALLRRSSGWFGGDGIFVIPMSGIDRPGAADEEEQIILFSDTMIGQIEDSVLQEGFRMVNNSVAIIRGKAPEEGRIAFFLAQDSSGKEKALFTPDLPEMEAGEYYWLGDGFRDPVNGTTYVFAYRVVDRPEYEFLKFDVVGGALIAIPSGSTFPYVDQRQIALPFFFRGENQQFGSFGAGILPNLESAGAPYPDGYIYLYGVRDPRKQMIVARVRPGEIEELDRWRFWDGKSWNPDFTQTAEITDSVSNELSVTPLEDGRYLAVFQVNTISKYVGIRVGESPVGPWGPVINVWDCTEALEAPEFFVYNAKAHPSLSQPGELLISYNVNSADFWNQIHAYPQLYRPRFFRLILGE